MKGIEYNILWMVWKKTRRVESGGNMIMKRREGWQLDAVYFASIDVAKASHSQNDKKERICAEEQTSPSKDEAFNARQCCP